MIMNKRVKGNKLRVGDRVRVIYAGIGASGANGYTGTIIENFPLEICASGLGRGKDTILIKLDKPAGFMKNIYWGLDIDGIYEIIPKRKKHIEVDIIIKDDLTKVVVGDKVGVSRCKEEDSFNESYGVILAVARAYGLSNEKREALVDVLYDDVKTLEDYDTLEILDELKSRVED